MCAYFCQEAKSYNFCRLDEIRDDTRLQAPYDDISFPDFGFSQPSRGDVAVESLRSLASGRVSEAVSHEII